MSRSSKSKWNKEGSPHDPAHHTEGARGGRVGEVEAFLCVAEAGTFSAAARLLELTPSAVSKLVSRLEARLRVSLFARSTRGLTLTEEGLTYREHSERLVSGFRRVEEAIGQHRRSAEGRLLIAAPRELAEHHLAHALPEFVGAYPQIEIELVLSVGQAFPTAPKSDVAIHLGAVHDETLCIRKLGTTSSLVVAAPSYLRARGEPQCPVELAQHVCLRHVPGRFATASSSSSADAAWTFVVDGKLWRHVARAPTAAAGIQSDDLEVLRRLALLGMGVACLPDFMVDRDIASGRLVVLLQPYFAALEEPVSAVFIADAHRPYRVRAFVDFLAERPLTVAAQLPFGRRLASAAQQPPRLASPLRAPAPR